MLHDNMDISRLMFHAQRVEETWLKRKNRDFKRAKSYEGGTPKDRLDIQDKPRFKKTVFNQVPSNFLKENKDRVSNPRSQKVRSGNSPSDKPTCAKCGKKRKGECLVGREIAMVVARVSIRLGISLMWGVKRRGMIKLKQVVLDSKLQRGTIFMLSVLGVNKRNLPMWSPICYKSSLFMFMLYDILVLLCHL